MRKRKRATSRQAAVGDFLPPITNLSAGEGLRSEISMLWTYLGSNSARLLLGKDWKQTCADLVQRAIDDNDDDALIELVKRDVRYLGTELVMSKALLWKLQVIHGAAHKRKGASRQKSEVARTNLEKLSKAIAYVTGRGNVGYVLFPTLLRIHDDSLENVRKASAMLASKRPATDAVIANATGLSPRIVERLRRFPKQIVQCAEEATVEEFSSGFSVERLRTLIREARLDATS
jgi:hypothetical protein